jgi:dihydrolipoamide dehydrogenase
MMDQVLPGMPRDLIQPLLRRLREQGITVLTGARALGYEEQGDGLQMRVEVDGTEQTIPCARILVTVGRKPNSEDLALDTVGLKADSRGFIAVNDRLETGADGVYAIGDVTGGPLLAHRASKMGEVCADIIAGKPAAFDAMAVPSVVYSSPEIAMTGYTEEQAREEGYKVIAGKFPFAASGRAMTMQDTRGFIKVVADSDSQAILGVQAVGANVSELIAEGTLAVEMGAVLHDVAGTVHPHPTLSEALMEAALVTLGEAIHIMPR